MFRETFSVMLFGWLKAYILLAGPFLLGMGYSGIAGLWGYIALLPLTLIAFNYSVGYWPWFDPKEAKFLLILGTFVIVYLQGVSWIMNNALPLISKTLP